LNRELADNKVSLAFSNPPFVLAPEYVVIETSESGLLPEGVETQKVAVGHRVDFKQLFAKAGWGGKDGLRITKHFLNVFGSRLAADGQIIIYSQFAGDQNSPTKIYDSLSENQSSHFERFREDEVNLTASQWANYVSRVFVTKYPLLHGTRFQQLVKLRTLDLLQSEKVAKMHSGFLIIRTSDGIPSHSQNSITGFSDFSAWDAFKSQPSFLRQILSAIGGPTELEPSKYVGGDVYQAPKNSKPDSGEKIALDSAFFDRSLNAENGDFNFSVGVRNGKPWYIVRRGDDVVEDGQALNESKTGLTARYSEILKAVKLLRQDQILRSFEYEFQAYVPASLLSQVFGLSSPKDEMYLEEVAVTNRYSLKGNRVATYRGSIGDRNYLRLRVLLNRP